MNYLGTTLFIVVIILFIVSDYQMVSAIAFYFQKKIDYRFYLNNKQNYKINLDQIKTEGYLIIAFVQYIFYVTLTSYLKGAFGDPGFLPNLQLPSKQIYLERFIKECKKCVIVNKQKSLQVPQFKPPRAHHCSVCQKCIYRMDHHCEWLNNCVGYKNQKFFIQFLIFTIIFCLLFLLSMGSNFYIAYMNVKKFVFLFVLMDWYKILLGFLSLFAVIFIPLCVAFLSDQRAAIKYNQTTIESYKETLGQPRPFSQTLKTIFGPGLLVWFLPIMPKNIEINYLELLYDDDTIDEQEIFLEDYFNEPEFNEYWVSEKDKKDDYNKQNIAKNNNKNQIKLKQALLILDKYYAKNEKFTKDVKKKNK